MIIADQLDEYFDAQKIPERISKVDLELVSNWLKAQPHLPSVSDRQISIFLHCCNGVELTKSAVDNFYTLRTLAPEMFSGRSLKSFEKTYKIVYVFKLKNSSLDDCRLFFGGLSCLEPEKLDVAEVAGLFFSLVDVHANLEPYAPGWRIILDAKGFSFGHFVKLSTCLGMIKKIICYVQDAIPIRLEGIHVVNASPIVIQFVGIIKPFMKKHLYDMIQLLPTDLNSLHEIVNPDSFPTDKGGKCCTIEEYIQTSMDNLEKYIKWFDLDEKYARTDESKRLKKDVIKDDYSFGAEGSFKKLSLD